MLHDLINIGYVTNRLWERESVGGGGSGVRDGEGSGVRDGEGSGVRDGEILPSKLCTIDLHCLTRV